MNEMSSPRELFTLLDFYFDKSGITSLYGSSFDRDGFTVNVSYARAAYKLTVRRIESLHYRYTIAGMGNSITGDVFSKAEWKLEQTELLTITNAISQFQSTPKQAPAVGKPSDFRQILSDLLDRISSIAKETQSLIDETRSKMPR